VKSNVSNSSLIGSDNEDFNSVSVSSETEWASWPPTRKDGFIGLQFNPKVSLQEKKVAVYTDLNCQRRDQCAKVATNVLAKNMRPMYRNNLLIVGRPIKPWDVIYLKDNYVDMDGPLEVERVIHHYSAERGWVTNIVPHAMCDANPGNRFIQAAIFNNRIDKVMNIADTVLWVWTLASIAVPVLGAGGAALSTGFKFGAKKLLSVGQKEVISLGVKEASAQSRRAGFGALANQIGGSTTALDVTTKFGILKKVLAEQTPAFLKSYIYKIGLVGGGAHTASRFLIQNVTSADKLLPVTFHPLMFKGVPLEAGLAGDDFSYWSISAAGHWAWSDFLEGVGALWHSLENPNVDTFNTTLLDSLQKSKL